MKEFALVIRYVFFSFNLVLSKFMWKYDYVFVFHGRYVISVIFEDDIMLLMYSRMISLNTL